MLYHLLVLRIYDYPAGTFRDNYPARSFARIYPARAFGDGYTAAALRHCDIATASGCGYCHP
jgi:hypothetical protein